MSVAIREAQYPRLEELKDGMGRLCKKAWYVDSSKIAFDLGTPFLTNIPLALAIYGFHFNAVSQEDL